MEVYILDSLYRRNQLVDDHVSLIWTERFGNVGEIQLSMVSTLQNRSRFVAGAKLGMSESYRVMTVETVEDTTDSDDRAILKISGRSLEQAFEDRALIEDITINPKWIATGLPADIATQFFHAICISGYVNTGDIIPGITIGSIFPADTIPAPADSVTVELDPMTLLAALVQICAQYDMGFRLIRDLDTTQLYFDVYMGSDRTSGQTTLPAVIFSPEFENLTNTTELTTVAGAKNVAYVTSPVGQEFVYPLDVDPTIEGFDRRVLLVNATDITDTVPADATAKMIQRGLEELSKYRKFSGFDGEISQTSKYKYGRDYNLGDLVEIRNVDGVTTNMQVTEQIFASDAEGERSYPTLSINKFITPGSWSAWPIDQVWNDLDSDTMTWADQP